MTPEATYAALHLLDRWRLMLAALAGAPPPPLPDVPGRVHQCQDDPLTPADREALLASDATDSEIGACLGVTRQRAWQMRQKLRQAALLDADNTTD